MSSFYGGKQGRTYHIVARYNSVQDMVIQFQKGGAYTQANYGQYVLIDTVKANGRSNLQNGLLYRRGFDFNEPYNTNMPSKKDSKYKQDGNFDQEAFLTDWNNWTEKPGGGAIYVGQIVGPEGRSPQVKIEEWDELVDQIEHGEGYGAKNKADVKDSPGLHYDEKSDPDHEHPIYNDTIKAGYVNILDEYGDITGCWISFDIPYSVFNITAQSVDAYGQDTLSKSNIEGTHSSTYQITSEYDEETNTWKYNDLIYEQPESKEHPFFHNFDIAVPKGIHGQNITEIKVESGKETKYNLTTDKQIDETKNYYIKEDNQFVLVESPQQEDLDKYYEYTSNETVDEDKYFTYTTKNFDSTAAGIETAHLGRWPYRVINEIKKENTDRPFFKWEEAQTVEEGVIYKLENAQGADPIYVAICIQGGTTGAEAPIFKEQEQDYEIGKIVQSNETQWLVTTLPSAAPAAITHIYYTAGKDQEFNNHEVDYIFVDGTGKMFVVYSHQKDTAYYLTYVNSIQNIEANDGSLNIYYKNGQIDSFAIPQDLNIEYSDEDSSVTIGYYQGTEEITTEEGVIEQPRYIENTFYIKQITDLTFVNQHNIEGKQYLEASYKGVEEEEDRKKPISDSINRILAVERWGDCLIALYSDPDFRNGIDEQHTVIKSWTDNNINPSKTYPELKWYNFGPIGSQYHIQGNYTYDDLAVGGALEHGFTGDLASRAGWLVTVQDGEVLRCYAYDYNPDSVHESLPGHDGETTHWYEIFSLAEQLIDPQKQIRVSERTNTGGIWQEDQLKPNGVWFIVSGGHDSDE